MTATETPAPKFVQNRIGQVARVLTPPNEAGWMNVELTSVVRTKTMWRRDLVADATVVDFAPDALARVEAMVAEARRLEDDYGDNFEVMSHMSELADILDDLTITIGALS